MRLKNWLPFNQGSNRCWIRSHTDKRFLQAIVFFDNKYLCYLFDLSGNVVQSFDFSGNTLSEAKTFFRDLV